MNAQDLIQSLVQSLGGLDPDTLVAVALAITVGGMVKGVTGIGLPIVTISICITLDFLPPQEAIALVVIPILVTNLWQGFRTRGTNAQLKRFWPLVATFLVCLFVGSQLLAKMETHVMFAVLGVTASVFAATSLWKPRADPLSDRAEKFWGPIAGGVGGLMGGVATIWGPPMMMYFVMLKLSKDEWVRTIGLIWFIGAIPLTAFYWSNGILNPSNIWLSAAACAPGMMGTVVGEFLRRWINEDLFRKVMLMVLFLIGLNLIRRALF